MNAIFTHCAKLVRELDRDRYLATLFAPADKRDALFALYAFEMEIARVRDVAREAMPGEIRLQWWREALEGKRDSEARAHPVAAALRETVSRYTMAPDRLIALIDAHQADLYDEPIATLEDFDRYAMLTQSALFELACEILGVGAESVAVLTRPAGVAYTARNALAELARYPARGQRDLPGELLRQHALAGLAVARAAAVPAQALPALLPMATVGAQLRLFEQRGDEPFQVEPLSRLKRQWLIWRAAHDPRRIFA